MTRWPMMLRLAARDALRARGRSILVLVMIVLPVLGVSTAAVVLATVDVSGDEALGRRLGAADARVSFVSPGPIAQRPDPNGGFVPLGRSGDAGPSAVPEVEPGSLDRIAEVLGGEVSGTSLRERRIRVGTDAGVTAAAATELDLAAPVVGEMYRLLQGRVPEDTDEVVVSPGLAERGPGLGEELVVRDVAGEVERRLEVVGIVRDAHRRDAESAVGLPGAFGDPSRPALAQGRHVDWLVDAGGPVSWSEVRALNDAGAMVVSRAVLADPPPDSAVPRNDMLGGGGVDSAVLAVIVLVVTMALLEVVLLAGPAFAVGARRQQRTLALVAANGGTPRQLRRVVLASAVVLGGTAAALGVAGGIATGWALQPVVQRFSGEWLGPFDVPWWQLLGVAGFGLLSAFLAAVVPAWLAARQDVVAVLAGRRGDRRPGVGFPILGLGLLGVGVALAVWATRRSSMGEYLIAASALPTVLGMVLVIPVVVALVARLGRWLPLPLRYAVRDAARHRTRTVPAVAAVAATVMGVVTLGIAAASDEAQSRESYRPVLAMGDGSLVYQPFRRDRDPDTWKELKQVVTTRLPAAEVTPVTGVLQEVRRGGYRDIALRAHGRRLVQGYASAYGTGFLAGSELPDLPLGVSGSVREQADAVLGRGGVVVFSTRAPAGETTVRVRSMVEQREEPPQRSAWVEVPGLVVPPASQYPMAAAVLSPQAARAIDVPVVETALVLDAAGAIGAAAEQDIGEAISAVSPAGSFHVERGYQNEDGYVIVLLVLGALGGLLLLGGTLTATFLALSDARPDLATLAAIGSAPRTRRAVAAAYALVVAGVGAVTGALVGLVPGIAVSYPLTRGYGAVATHYLDVPWPLLGAVVLGLPLLAALAVGLFARSRLPMVARVE